MCKSFKMMSSHVAKWCHHIATSQQRGEIVFHVVIFFTGPAPLDPLLHLHGYYSQCYFVLRDLNSDWDNKAHFLIGKYLEIMKPKKGEVIVVYVNRLFQSYHDVIISTSKATSGDSNDVTIGSRHGTDAGYVWGCIDGEVKCCCKCFLWACTSLNGNHSMMWWMAMFC